MPIKKLGHVGIYAKDVRKLRQFYTDVVGLQVADEDLDGLGACFMTSDPEREHHEFVIFGSRNGEETCVQQISFSCESLQDVINYYDKFKQYGVRFDRVTNHGNAVGLYFFDPEGNHCEVYWTTPWKAHQPYGVAIDVTKPVDQILKEIEADVARYGETGHRDPESYKVQREQLLADGIRV